MTRAQKLAYQLAQACSGRENHAALVEVRAVRIERDMPHAAGRVKLLWGDRFTGQAGLLGIIDDFEADAVVRTLFTQLRQWRALCENSGQAPARAKAVGA